MKHITLVLEHIFLYKFAFVQYMFDIIDHPDYFGQLNFDKHFRMHSFACQFDFWSSSFEFMFFDRSDGRPDGRPLDLKSCKKNIEA